MEKHLSMLEDQGRSYLDVMGAILVALDKSGKVTLINKTGCAMMGYPSEEIAGKNFADTVVIEKDREYVGELLAQSFKGDRLHGSEISILTKSGEEKSISWYDAELFDDKGNITAVLLLGYDVVNRKEIEKSQRLAQLGKLVSDLAHEVNNPLMVISGRAQLSLMEDDVADEIKSNLNIIVSECQRAKLIIDRLLKFSRPSKGESKEVDVNQCIDEVVSLIEHQYNLTGLSIEKKYSLSLKPIWADGKQIQEVILNLFSNAKDSIEDKGSMTIITSAEEDYIKIEIKDTGCGIKEDHLPRVFNPFFTTKEKGAGLGLSVCYGIVNLHQGTLSIHSTLGEGTTAVILLPIKKENDNV